MFGPESASLQLSFKPTYIHIYIYPHYPVNTSRPVFDYLYIYPSLPLHQSSTNIYTHHYLYTIHQVFNSLICIEPKHPYQVGWQGTTLDPCIICSVEVVRIPFWARCGIRRSIRELLPNRRARKLLKSEGLQQSVRWTRSTLLINTL